MKVVYLPLTGKAQINPSYLSNKYTMNMNVKTMNYLLCQFDQSDECACEYHAQRHNL